MHQSSKPKYSREQIMAGLREIMFGVTNSRRALDVDTRIDEYMKATDSTELGPLELLWGIERCFGLRLRWAEWNEFPGPRITTVEEWETKVGPRYTFGRLADFIGERVEVVALGSISVLGKPCDLAGAFQAIELVAKQVRPRGPAFGPSTPINRVLVGAVLSTFWDRLRWMTEEAIPPLRTTTLTRLRRTCCAVGVLASLVLLIWTLTALFRAEWLGALRHFGMVPCFVLGTFALCRLMARLDNRLPDGLRTFKDLAAAVAGSAAFARSA